jgi:hypothetical protein
MKRKSIYCYIMAALFCLSLIPSMPERVNAASATTEGLSLYLKFDGDLSDSSGKSNNAVCALGNITYQEGILGKCAAFDGKSYIRVEDSDALDLKDNFTISLWIYKEILKDNDYIPYVTKEEDEEYWGTPYSLYEHWKNTPCLYLHNGGADTGPNQELVEGTVIDIRKWFLLTATYDGKEVRLYHDKQVVRRMNLDGATASTVGDLLIGMKDDTQFFKGKMDDLRIYNRAISADDVSALYDDGLASKPAFLQQKNSLVAHYKFENNFNDASEYGNDARKATGKGTVTFVDAVNGKGAKFTKGSYLEVEADDSINFDKGFTLTGWLLVSKGNVDSPVIHRLGASNGYEAEEYAYNFSAYEDGYNFTYTPFVYDYNPDASYFSPENGIINKWYHIGVTFDGKQIRWYQNGVLVEKKALDGIEIAHADEILMIGSNGESFYEGIMDELKLYNYALSGDEVKVDYNRKDSLSISKTNQNDIKAMKVKGTVTLKPSRKYIETGKTAALTSGVTYKTSNSKIFTVSKTGKITAVKKGSAKLTVTHGGISKTYTVTVK